MSTDPVALGERLRRVRQSRGLTLHDVQAASNGEFRASALGAYERAERSLSITRLLRLCEIYAVDASTLFEDAESIDLVQEHEDARTPNDEQVHAAIARFSDHVRTSRATPSGGIIRVRSTDFELLGVVLAQDRERLDDAMGRLGLQVQERDPAARTPAPFTAQSLDRRR